MAQNLRTLVIWSSIAVLLSGCGDPLRDVDRLSSVELDDEVATASIAPADEARGGGFLSGLLRPKNEQAAATPSQTDIAVQTALGEQEALPDEKAAAAPAADTTPAQPQRRGLFGLLRASAQPEPVEPTVATVQSEQAQDVAPQLPAATDDTVSADLASDEKVEALVAQTPAAEARPRRGLFGLLSGARAKAGELESDTASVQTASLGPVAQPKLSASRRAHKGPDTAVVAMGTTLAPGAIARVCDAPRGRLGKEVGRFPERGKGYRMYDSAPRSSGPRPFYVTGFDDGCARTFTAALALFGSPSMHEQLRYGLPSEVQPYSTTDKAYEGIKQSICRVGKRKPCGAKVGLLEKDTVFISIYDRLGSNSKWSNILLHKGWVLAADRKG